MHSHAHAPENMYIVRPQYEYGTYKVTQSSQQSLPGYSCPAVHGMFTVITPPGTSELGRFNAVLQCRICCVVPHTAEARNSLPRMTKVSNRPILHIDRWSITIQRACFMHISCIILKVITKSWGTNTLLVPPQPKSWGGLVYPGPHGCCAYVPVCMQVCK